MLEIKIKAVDNDFCSADYDMAKQSIYSISYTNGADVTYVIDDMMGDLYIESINVPDELRGTGIGTEIVNSIIAEFECYEFHICAKAEVQAWWERFGFVASSGDDEYVFMDRKCVI